MTQFLLLNSNLKLKHPFHCDNIHHEGNISEMPVFDVLTLLECRKHKSRSHQNQNQNSLLVKRQTDNTTPGGMELDRRGLVPSSHKRSKFRHTII